MIDDRSQMSQHQVRYFTTGGALGVLSSGIKRFDFKTGNNETYDFGSNTVVGEPVFVSNSTNKTDEGWLLTQCLDGVSGKSFFAVFDSNTVIKGPICKIWLNHHLPIPFHGSWQNII
jgi:all-trans-8'-apo-beta-carotenal 15,15'-oxygenase